MARVREVIERYRELIVIDGQPHPETLRAGAEIAVIGGPFSGWRGLFECYEREGRVKILLDTMGARRVVAIPEALISPR
jgi:transcription antitermination factor NusG